MQQRPAATEARDLTPAELCAVAEELGRRRWRGIALDLDADRSWQEVPAGDRLSSWVIHWGETADTGFHDHDLSAGAVHVVYGRVREERLRLGGPPECREYGPGETFTIAASEIHRVLHVGAGPALTVHAYSPRLAADGRLRAGGRRHAHAPLHPPRRPSWAGRAARAPPQAARGRPAPAHRRR